VALKKYQAMSGKLTKAPYSKDKHHHRIFLRIAGLLILFAPTPYAAVMPSEDKRTFGIEERAACQEIIEDVRWSYRIWPVENKTNKPPRAEIFSTEQIRTKVENNLRMGTCWLENQNIGFGSQKSGIAQDHRHYPES
jgi:hypothetical protein